MAADILDVDDDVNGRGGRELLNICGVEVDFPFRPYPCQLVYMEKVIESLQSVRASKLHFDLPTTP